MIYDLADPEQWTAAGEERRAWGREKTAIHPITNDVVVIEYRPGGAALAGSEERGGMWT